MGSIVKISPGGQVRIPKEIMDRVNLSPGDYLDFEIRDDRVVVHPKKLISAEQAWFWEKDWQSAEKEAGEDIKAGRVSKVFTSAQDGIGHLRGKRGHGIRKTSKG